MALTPVCLRLETPDGRAVEEYCIHDGEVEARLLLGDARDDHEWHQLTPEQLIDHVNRDTVVAQWLKRRLGWQPLLRACGAQTVDHSSNSIDLRPDQRAA